MKTLDYMKHFSSLPVQEKYVAIKELRQKIFNLRIEGVAEDKLMTVKALIHWTAANFLLTGKHSPPTIEELSIYMNNNETENEVNL